MARRLVVHVYNTRRGRRLADAGGGNPNHDPSNGQFATGGGSSHKGTEPSKWISPGGGSSGASPEAKKETASAVLSGIKPDAPERIELPHSKGIPRKDMPQILREDRPALLKQLTEAGYKVSEEKVKASELMPTQSDLIKGKVIGAKERLDAGKWDRPIIVSKDGYILDGHHIWAAQLARNDADMDVTRVDASIGDLLKESSKFLGTKNPEGSGSSTGAGAKAKNPAGGLIEKYAGQTPRDKEGQVKLGAKIAERLGASKMVAEAREKLAKAIPTNASEKEGGHIGENGQWTPARAELHEKLLGDIFTAEAVSKATPPSGQRPIVTMLGGRGGSGKSWLTDKDGPVDKSKAILIDADHFKTALPEYEGWNAALLHEESDYLVNRAAKLAEAAGLNVIFDATLKSRSTVDKRVAQFSKTHDIHGYYMFASPETATERATGRFKRGMEKDGKGRFVPPEVVMANTDNEKNFDEAIPHFSKWGVYDNNSGSGPVHVASGGKE
jgi:predicted ABC-type ATPase